MQTPSQALGSYKYEPLKSAQWIRLLKVLPSPQLGDGVTCTIEQVNTDDDQAATRSYEAVSWNWGNGELTRSLHILGHDGLSFEKLVSEHLYGALQALRMKSKNRYLWVDALCINMEDTEERNQQVAKMSEIYGQAVNVCIWLGETHSESDKAMDFIENKILDVLDFDALCAEMYLDSWAALLDLMKRDWFQRKWIVQEVSLAKSATVHCGTKFIDWSSFAAAVSLFVDVAFSARKLNEVAKKKEQFRDASDFFEELPALSSTRLVNITELLCKKSAHGIIQRTATLEDIVAQLATFETSEPRDNIYSLLALAKDSQPAVSGISDHLNGKVLTELQKRFLSKLAKVLPNPHRQRYIVDYKQSVVDVYQHFIAFAISKSDPQRALDIICRPFAAPYTVGQDVKFDPDRFQKLSKTQRDTQVELPSWISSADEVPFGREKAWIPERKKNVYSMERRRGDSFVSSNNHSISYNAALGKAYSKDKVRFRKRTDHYSMYVEGFILDRVEEVEAPASAGVIPAQWLKRGQEYSEHPDHDSNAFWKTLVADRSPYGNALPYYKIALEAALKEAIDKKTSFNTDKRIRADKSQVVSSTLRQVQATIWERRLFETERDRHLGIGPAQMKPGDLVCILYGLSVPVILRKVDKTPAAIQKEKREDEQDRLLRQDRVKDLLKKLFQRRAAKRNKEEFDDVLKTKQHVSRLVEKVFPSFPTKPERPRPAELHGDSLDHSPAIATAPKPESTHGAPSVATMLESPAHQADLQLFLLGLLIHGIQRLADRVKTRTTVFDDVHHLLNPLMGSRSAAFCILTVMLLLMLPNVFGIATPILGSRKIALCIITAIMTLAFPDELATRALTRYHEGFWKQDQPPPKAMESQTGSDETSALHDSTKAVDPSSDATVNAPEVAQGTERLDEEPSSEYYTLIGECYVHEMMNGSAIQWQNDSVTLGQDKRVKPRIFELR